MKIYKPEPLIRVNVGDKRLSLTQASLVDVLLHIDYELSDYKTKQVDNVTKVLVREYKDSVNGKCKTLKYYGITPDEVIERICKNL